MIFQIIRCRIFYERRRSILSRKGIMTEDFKEELAKELGFWNVVESEGWGGIRARDAGNMVKLAIEKGQSSLQRR